MAYFINWEQGNVLAIVCLTVNGSIFNLAMYKMASARCMCYVLKYGLCYVLCKTAWGPHYIQLHMHMYIHVHIHIHIPIHVYIHIHNTYTHAYVYIYIYILYIHIHIHICIHIHIYIHIHNVHVYVVYTHRFSADVLRGHIYGGGGGGKTYFLLI